MDESPRAQGSRETRLRRADPTAGEPTAVGRSASIPVKVWAIICWFALLGIAATIVGGHDAVVGTGMNVRLVAVLVLGAGLLLLAGVVGLCGGQSRGRVMAVIAGVMGVALGALMSLTQIANDQPDGRLALWGAISVLSALAPFSALREVYLSRCGQGGWMSSSSRTRRWVWVSRSSTIPCGV